MGISRHLLELSQEAPRIRREALACVLSMEGIEFSREEDTSGRTVNFSFSSCGGGEGCLVFSAHYDNFRDSPGANDNMAAVCILIDLRGSLEASGVGAEFLLTDGEEYGNTGASLWCETHNVKDVAGVLCLDVCGYGDSIIVCGKGHEHKPAFRRFTAREILRRHNAQITRYIPPGEDAVFRKYHVPVLSVSIVPKWDVQYMKALASFGDRLLGQPPEFEMIFSQMEILQTMHGGEKDSPDYVQPEAMQKVYSYLSEAMTAQQDTQKFSLTEIFRRLIT